MKKLCLIVMVIVLMAGLIFTSCAKQSAPATAPTSTSATQPATTFVLRAASVTPEAHPLMDNFRFWASLIEKRSSGRITFKLFPGAVLAPLEQMLDACAKGVFDVIPWHTPAYWHGNVPEGDWMWIPFAAATPSSQMDAYHNTEIRTITDAAFARVGIKILSDFAIGPQILLMMKPVRTLEDLKGLKIRGAGGASNEGIKCLGASPITVAGGEMVIAMQRGTVDGTLGGAYFLESYKLRDVVKYITTVPLINQGVLTYINPKTWDNLPTDLQEIIRVSTSDAEWASAAYWEQWNEVSVARAKVEKGIETIDLSPTEIARWKTACEPVWTWYAGESPDCARIVQILRDYLKPRF